MATLALNEVWRLRVACYTPTQVGLNVLHYKVSAVVGSGGTDVAMADVYDAALAPLYKAVLSDDARYRGVSVQRATPAPPTLAVVSADFDGPGTVAGEILPGQVAGIISTKTGFAGRKHRGRVYLPFASEADNEVPGLPTDTYVSAVNTLANALFLPRTIGSGGNTSDIVPVILHRVGLTNDQVVSWLAKKLWATQRRRGSYGRHNLPPF